jgi:hypothetical protein
MNPTQGDRIISALRGRWLTYGEMQRLGVSTCPQKRVIERLAHHPDLELLKARGDMDGLIRWRVAKRRV